MGEENFIQEAYNIDESNSAEPFGMRDKGFVEVDELVKEKPIQTVKPVEKKVQQEKKVEEKKPEVKPKQVQKKKFTKKKTVSKKKTILDTKLITDTIDKSMKKTKKLISSVKKAQAFSMLNNHKRKKSKAKVNGLITIVAILGIVAISLFIANLSKIFPDQGRPLAVVNGEIITEKDVEQTLKTVPDMYKTLLDQDVILNQTIMNTILLQESSRLGLEASDYDVEQTIKEARELAQISEEEFEQYLEDQDLTLKEMKEFYKTHLSIENLLQQEAYPGITVEFNEIQSFYSENQGSLENATFDEVKDQIENYLIQQKQADAFEIYFAELYKNSEIRLLNIKEESGASFYSEEVEKYSDCALANGLEKETVIFVYSNSCPHCLKMQPIVSDLELEDYKFKWASASDNEARALLKKCYSDVLAGGVPQFICAKNGQTIVGERTKTVLQEFAEACQG
jgi:thiol-disulfide isomerase/thioredoxin